MADLSIYEQSGTDPFDAPIPGESLTEDPRTQKPWERPPEYTNVDDAIKDIFMRITDEAVYSDLMEAIRGRTPLDMIAQTLLFKGYMNGKFTTDLMLILIEPTLYLLMLLAEHNKIYDYLVYAEEEEDLNEEEQIELMNDDMQRMRPKPQVSAEKAERMVPDSLLAQVRSAPMVGEE
jgi:hypothetical protein